VNTPTHASGMPFGELSLFYLTLQSMKQSPHNKFFL